MSKPKTTLLSVLRKAFYFLEPNRRWVWFGLLGLGLATSTIEAATALMIFAVLRIVQEGTADFDLPIVGNLSDRFSGLSTQDLLVFVSVSVVIFFLMRAVLLLFQTYAQNRIASNAGVMLADRLLKGYLMLDYSFHLNRNSAELIRNVATSVDRVTQVIFVAVISLTTEALIVVGLFVVLLLSAPLVGLLIGAAMAALMMTILRITQSRFTQLGTTTQQMSSASLQALQQSLQGLRDLKLLGRQGFFYSQYTTRRFELSRANYLQTTLTTAPRVLVETSLVVFMMLFVLGLTLTGAHLDESLSLLGLFAYSAFRFMPAINRILTFLGALRFAGPAIDDIYGEFQTFDTYSRTHDEEVGREIVFERSIELQEVSYTYGNSEELVLEDVNLRISKGQSVGIVGSTGAGKSTLIDIILGLLAPTAGAVLVDGVDIHEAPSAWQKHVGVVSQNVYLIDDSLKRNIAFGLEDQEIDDARVNAVVAAARLSDFVAELTEGTDTLVGERGVRLSGGERQRVAIARALYRDPEVLVLDEGTSALDTVTEAQVIAEIERVGQQKTLIIVAHRLSTVRNCDAVVLLNRGRIVGLGTFDELVERNAVFRRMTTAAHQV
ncbi:MAG: ABC transporter ATP-binding protein/permease [Actinomycetota bacterium]|nr:ABC transporter ATP-binding protein/permease [Actinomycetota bacterium]